MAVGHSSEFPFGQRLIVPGDNVCDAMAPAAGPASPIDSLVSVIRGVSQRDDFNDDFSMVELGFG